MADVPATLTGLSALLVAVLGLGVPAARAIAPVVTAPPSQIAPVGSPTVIGGASLAGFSAGPVRLVITVSSGVVGLPAAALDLTIPTGYPELGATGAQLAIEGDEAAVNVALADLAWTAAEPAPAELTLDVGPAGTMPDGTIPIRDSVVGSAGPLVVRSISSLRAAYPPAAPAISNASAGTGEATVHWSQPPSDGGAPVLGYVVTGDPGGWCAVAPTQTACVLRDLVGGAAHTFRVAAINEAGLGSWSAPSASVTPRRATTVVLTSSPAGGVVAGEPVQLLASVEAGPGAPTGSVTYLDGGREIGAAPVGVAISVADLGVGWHRLAARYGGDDTFGPSVSTSIDIDVKRPPAPTDTIDSQVRPFPVDPPADATVETTSVPPVDDTEPPSAAAEGGSSATTAAPSAATTTSPTAAATGEAPVPSAATTEGSASATAEASVGVAPTDPAAAESATERPAVGGPSLTVVFQVGPGAELANARFTVRGKALSPGTIVTVTAHSDPILVGTAEVAADATLLWTGQLPADLPDGDHRLIAEGVAADGSNVERTTAFTAEAGRLTRIGASSVETIAPITATPAPEPVPEAPAEAPGSASGGGRSSSRLLLLAALLLVAGVLWWRARSRRQRPQNAAASDQPAAAAATDGPGAGWPTPAPAGPATRRHAPVTGHRAARRLARR